MDSAVEYKYEIGFSFLKQDEIIAYDIYDRIQDRMSAFIYSKQQEELGGTDGENKFNSVFYKECRLVVVLYRDGWGETPWTRIEETAIKNRAFDNGWEFLLIINLDSEYAMPKWIPKTYVWLDYKRFKAEGAIAVIEQKVKESGGDLSPETIAHKAESLKRLRAAQKNREEFLNSLQAFEAAKSEVELLIQKVKNLKPIIEDPSTYLHLSTGERPTPPMYEFGFKDFYLCFNNSSPFEYSILNGKLRITLYKKVGHQYIDYREIISSSAEYRFDRNILGMNGWSDHTTGKGFLTTEEIIDKWVKQFIKEISLI